MKNNLNNFKKPIQTAIQTNLAPAAIGLYSQAVSLEINQINNLIFLSGQIALDPKTSELITGDFEARARQVFKNMEAVCQAAGAKDLNQIVKLSIFLTDLSDFSKLNSIMKEFFTEPYPARSTVQVSGLPRGADIEIEGILVV